MKSLKIVWPSRDYSHEDDLRLDEAYIGAARNENKQERIQTSLCMDKHAALSRVVSLQDSPAAKNRLSIISVTPFRCIRIRWLSRGRDCYLHREQDE